MAIGDTHRCAMSSDGRARCWGYGAVGQLGLEDRDYAASPTTVPFASAVTAIATGAAHSCAIAGGEPWCWGRGASGQLGSGEAPREARTPVRALLSDIVSIAAGRDATCALTATAEVWCWGRAEQGIVTGADVSVEAPTLLSTGPASRITVGGRHICWQLSDTLEVRCRSGSTDDEIDTSSWVGAADLAAGWSHVCAVVDGSVRCAGENNWGELGDGSSGEHAREPVIAVLSSPAVEVEALDRATCALLASGEVHCWGFNEGSFILGESLSTSTPTPRHVASVAGQHLFCGSSSCCVIREPGDVRCWGNRENEGEPESVRW
nr:hypothetical protein [Sandaracinus sp.]